MELFTAPTRAAQRRTLRPPEVATDERILEAALATLTAPVQDDRQVRPTSRAGLADALGWPLARLDAALSALDDRLADRGVGIDIDAPHTGRPVHGLRPRDRLLGLGTPIARTPATGSARPCGENFSPQELKAMGR